MVSRLRFMIYIIVINTVISKIKIPLFSYSMAVALNLKFPAPKA